MLHATPEILKDKPLTKELLEVFGFSPDQIEFMETAGVVGVDLGNQLTDGLSIHEALEVMENLPSITMPTPLLIQIDKMLEVGVNIEFNIFKKIDRVVSVNGIVYRFFYDVNGRLLSIYDTGDNNEEIDDESIALLIQHGLTTKGIECGIYTDKSGWFTAYETGVATDFSTQYDISDEDIASVKESSMKLSDRSKWDINKFPSTYKLLSMLGSAEPLKGVLKERNLTTATLEEIKEDEETNYYPINISKMVIGLVERLSESDTVFNLSDDLVSVTRLLIRNSDDGVTDITFTFDDQERLRELILTGTDIVSTTFVYDESVPKRMTTEIVYDDNDQPYVITIFVYLNGSLVDINVRTP